MNDDDFDVFLREALREPAPAAVPADVRAVEIDRAVAVALDDLAWDADAGDDVDGVPGDDRDDGSGGHGDGADAADPGHRPSDVWDDNDLDDPDVDDVWNTDAEDDPLLSAVPAPSDSDGGLDSGDWHEYGGHHLPDHGRAGDPVDPPHGGHDDADGD
jgi:hypothetical protein